MEAEVNSEMAYLHAFPGSLGCYPLFMVETGWLWYIKFVRTEQFESLNELMDLCCCKNCKSSPCSVRHTSLPIYDRKRCMAILMMIGLNQIPGATIFLSCYLPEIAIVFLNFPGHDARALLVPGKKDALLEPSLCFNETKSHWIEAEIWVTIQLRWNFQVNKLLLRSC